MRLSPKAPLAFFVALSLGAHGVVAVGAFVAAHVRKGPAPAAAAASLTSDTETELPLSEAAGESDPEVSPKLTQPSPERADPGTGEHRTAPATSRAQATKPTSSVSGAGAGAQPGLIGAVGEPGALMLEVAFLRALPQVASFDKDWNREPIGAKATVNITAEVDANGHLAQVTDASTSTPLNRAVSRAIAQLRPRLLTARAPATRITITCTVHTDEVHDGWHGDVFALGASAQDHGGTAFVSLATGRRVDFVVSTR